VNDDEQATLGRRLAEIEARNRARLRDVGIAIQLEQFEIGYVGPPSNPYFAWAAIHFAIEKQAEAPDWAKQYLADSAKQMVELAQRGAESKAIPIALGFQPSRGRPSAGSQIAHGARREAACAAFAKAVLSGSRKEEALRAGAAAAGNIEPGTVEEYLATFFPGHRNGEAWAEFFRDAVNIQSERYSGELAVLLRRHEGQKRSPIRRGAPK